MAISSKPGLPGPARGLPAPPPAEYRLALPPVPQKQPERRQPRPGQRKLRERELQPPAPRKVEPPRREQSPEILPPEPEPLVFRSRAGLAVGPSRAFFAAPPRGQRPGPKH